MRIVYVSGFKRGHVCLRENIRCVSVSKDGIVIKDDEDMLKNIEDIRGYTIYGHNGKMLAKDTYRESREDTFEDILLSLAQMIEEYATDIATITLWE